MTKGLVKINKFASDLIGKINVFSSEIETSS